LTLFACQICFIPAWFNSKTIRKSFSEPRFSSIEGCRYPPRKREKFKFELNEKLNTKGSICCESFDPSCLCIPRSLISTNWKCLPLFHDFVFGNSLSRFLLQDYVFCYCKTESAWRVSRTEIA
jgi:hypothetical protein